MSKLNFTVLLLLSFVVIVACKKEGCTDIAAINYNPEAEKNDGSCIYPDPVDEIEEVRITYGADPRQHFDLFIPANHDASTKTIFLIHGGAWCLGPLPDDPILLFDTPSIALKPDLLAAGYAVAEMKYRLACYTNTEAELTGDSHFYLDQMMADVQSAIDQLKSEAVALNIAADQYALLGESAGAHLALMAALHSDDPDLKTVISFYGPTLMDEASFKANASSFPYTNFAVNNVFALRDQNLGCTQRTTGTMDMFKAIESFVGHPLELLSTQPEYTDTISPAYEGNLVRNLPVFLMHGMADDLVPAAHGDSLLTALNLTFGTSPAEPADFASPHKLLKYNNCGHGWSGGACNKGQIRADVLEWLSIHF